MSVLTKNNRCTKNKHVFYNLYYSIKNVEFKYSTNTLLKE